MANYLLLGKRTTEVFPYNSLYFDIILTKMLITFRTSRVTRVHLRVFHYAVYGRTQRSQPIVSRPSHVKVQRSVSATAKPRRFSHGGDNANQNTTNSASATPATTTYKRQSGTTACSLPALRQTRFRLRSALTL